MVVVGERWLVPFKKSFFGTIHAVSTRIGCAGAKGLINQYVAESSYSRGKAFQGVSESFHVERTRRNAMTTRVVFVFLTERPPRLFRPLRLASTVAILQCGIVSLIDPLTRCLGDKHSRAA